MPQHYVVFIEPHAALFRYLEVAGRRFGVVVLTLDASKCRAEERRVYGEMGKAPASRIDRILECDITRVEAMLDALRLIRGDIAGVLPGDDPFVPVAAQLATRLGFHSASDEDAIAQQHKSAMKLRLHQHGIRTAPFVIAHTFQEAVQAWHAFGQDAVVKMVDYLGSLNVSRPRSEAELRRAWENIILNRYHPPTPFPLAQEVLIEAYIPGRDLSIEGYTQDGRCVVLNYNDKILDPHFIVIGHYLPAQVTRQESDALTAIARQCVDALGICNSVFHVEVKLQDGIPFVVESASRPPGQYMVDLMHRSYGIDLMDISVRLATGETVSDGPRLPRRHFAMLSIFAHQSGTFGGMQGWEQLKQRPGVLRTRVAVKRGAPITKLETFEDKYGFVIFEDESAAGVREQARWFRENVRMKVTTKGAAEGKAAAGYPPPAAFPQGSGASSGFIRTNLALAESRSSGE